MLENLKLNGIIKKVKNTSVSLTKEHTLLTRVEGPKGKSKNKIAKIRKKSILNLWCEWFMRLVVSRIGSDVFFCGGFG